MLTPVQKAVNAYFDQAMVRFESTVRLIDFFGSSKPRSTIDFSKPIDDESLVRFVRSEKGGLKREFLARSFVSVDTFIDFRFGTPFEYFAEGKSLDSTAEKILFDKASANVKPTIRLYLDGRENPIEVMTDFGSVGMLDPSTVALFVGDILMCVEEHSKDPSSLAVSASEDSVDYVLKKAFAYFSSDDKVHSLKADLAHEYKVGIRITEKLRNALKAQLDSILSNKTTVKNAQQIIAERMRQLYPLGFSQSKASDTDIAERPRKPFPLKEFAIFAGAVAIGIAAANRVRPKKV